MSVRSISDMVPMSSVAGGYGCFPLWDAAAAAAGALGTEDASAWALPIPPRPGCAAKFGPLSIVGSNSALKPMLPRFRSSSAACALCAARGCSCAFGGGDRLIPPWLNKVSAPPVNWTGALVAAAGSPPSVVLSVPSELVSAPPRPEVGRCTPGRDTPADGGRMPPEDGGRTETAVLFATGPCAIMRSRRRCAAI